MTAHVSGMLGQKLDASDGTVGAVRDLFFDEETWTVRYVVLETGKWLAKREVLLPSANVIRENKNGVTLKTAASKQDVEKSPDVSLQKPVSREMELLLGKYWQWTPYWTKGLTEEMAGNIESEATERTKKEMEALSESHLRSVVELQGYRVAASDMTLGEISDFLLTDDDWTIDAMVVDTRRWLPGGEVQIDRHHLGGIHWAEETIAVDMKSDEVRHAPKPDTE